MRQNTVWTLKYKKQVDRNHNNLSVTIFRSRSATEPLVRLYTVSLMCFSLNYKVHYDIFRCVDSSLPTLSVSHEL